jgi:hypothetical protein
MKIEKLAASHERELRRWLMNHDTALAMHRGLRDYFLAPTPNFGTLAIRDDDSIIRTLCMFSKYDGKSYIHYFIGDLNDRDDLVNYIGFPCQAFFKTGQEPSDEWIKTLDVTPGYMVNHEAYNGVFSRVVPRFNGAVYEHP